MTLISPQQVAPTISLRFQRSLHVELRKIWCTKSTRSVLVSLFAITVLVCGVVLYINIQVTPEPVNPFVSAHLIGVINALAVPIIAIIVMSTDWSSRDVMTLFALEPKRGLVFWSKSLAAIMVCLALLVASVIGSVLVSILVALIAGRGLNWEVEGSFFSALFFCTIIMALMGIGIASVLQSPSLAITVTIVQALVVDTALNFVPNEIGTYFRASTATEAVFGDVQVLPTITSALLWVVLPLAVGYLRNLREEAK